MSCGCKKNNVPKTYKIVSIKKETEQVQTFTFDVSLGARPGQFVMVWLPGVDEVPMSVSMDDGKNLSITFFQVGDMTTELAKCKVGDLVGLRGPLGTHYEWKKGQHLILVAGGYGAAPMYFVANEAVKDECTVDFIVGARSKDLLLYTDEIKKLENTNLHIATDDGSEGHKGYNTEILEKLINQRLSSTERQSASGEASKNTPLDSTPCEEPHSRKASVFACGPEMMLKRISDICAEEEVTCFLSLERYMKCGYGLCGNCCMDPLGIRVCKDGPVISNDICRQLTEFGAYHRDELGRKKKF
ncbi:dihydroorotate dehydrogenase electron transfer subunit [Candidatus Peribacteria bacterium]|jgi:dihydroorotate dehydrogenase electron transfer subunit|nr:dihydroorotate dehydrogenase electron transfer subunit [Candidatus Peribacteria bacterium]MBT4020945.1 dihydroorotate dehydrogenase electron transfer subunit [Candidatus Peribacteria bacterium]MBT4240295.1 dihydroorotate dehydrogenase electron transfer subunit [Candidatus Peribacteria bacterium]MBT4473910.1 dihydroorotate dehydrogenase electron transfer subunit [Candidatus Peribacteria bacterium]